MHLLSLAAALIASAAMGFANQRGGTCLVVAVKDVAAKGRFDRLLALFEAALWVSALLALLHATGMLDAAPRDYAIAWPTIFGAGVFALGAFINRACLFGTIARLGTGDCAYLATLVGLFVGGLASRRFPAPVEIERAPLIFGWSWSILLAILLIGLRAVGHTNASDRQAIPTAWPPAIAATTIGVAFLVIFLTGSSVDYATFLTALARGQTRDWPLAAAVGVALLVGSLAGGWTAGTYRLACPRAIDLLRCFGGGALMGLATSLVPGGNTTLVVLAMPMLWPYAWLGFAMICATMFALFGVSRSIALAVSRP